MFTFIICILVMLLIPAVQSARQGKIEAAAFSLKYTHKVGSVGLFLGYENSILLARKLEAEGKLPNSYSKKDWVKVVKLTLGNKEIELSPFEYDCLHHVMTQESMHVLREAVETRRALMADEDPDNF